MVPLIRMTIGRSTDTDPQSRSLMQSKNWSHQPESRHKTTDIRKLLKKNSFFYWTPIMQEEFKNLKSASQDHWDEGLST